MGTAGLRGQHGELPLYREYGMCIVLNEVAARRDLWVFRAAMGGCGRSA